MLMKIYEVMHEYLKLNEMILNGNLNNDVIHFVEELNDIDIN